MTHAVPPTAGDARRAADRFRITGAIVGATPLSGGHIHASFRVACDNARGPGHFLVQCLNERVFNRLDEVMANIARVSAHLRAKLAAAGVRDLDRRTLTPVPSRAGPLLWRDDAGRAWRAFLFVDRVVTGTRVTSPRQAEQAGRAYGEFQHLLADLPGPQLHVTIPDFHDTPKRLAALEDAARADRVGRVGRCAVELAAIRERSMLASALAGPHGRGAWPTRIVHNDAKLSNILFDVGTGDALCVVDLDTVMPGLSLHDFGDMVRSMAATRDEDDPDIESVGVDLDLFAGLARGYLAAARNLLTPTERDMLAVAGQVITYEQAARYLTDYLMGDIYYRTRHPEQNLQRTRNQLALLRSLERHAANLARLVDACGTRRHLT